MFSIQKLLMSVAQLHCYSMLIRWGLCVIDAARLEMVTDQTKGDVPDLDGIPDGHDALIQRNQKLPLGHRRRRILAR